MRYWFWEWMMKFVKSLCELWSSVVVREVSALSMWSSCPLAQVIQERLFLPESKWEGGKPGTKPSLLLSSVINVGDKWSFELAVTSLHVSASLMPGGSSRGEGVVSQLTTFLQHKSPFPIILTILPVYFQITQRRIGISLLKTSPLPWVSCFS